MLINELTVVNVKTADASKYEIPPTDQRIIIMAFFRKVRLVLLSLFESLFTQNSLPNYNGA